MVRDGRRAGLRPQARPLEGGAEGDYPRRTLSLPEPRFATRFKP